MSIEKSVIPPNPLSLKYVGLLGAVNPFVANMAASRITMLSAQYSQRITLRNPDRKIIQSNADVELAKYTFSVKAPCDMNVLLVSYDTDSHKLSKSSGVYCGKKIIYEDSCTGIVDMLEVPT